MKQPFLSLMAVVALAPLPIAAGNLDDLSAYQHQANPVYGDISIFDPGHSPDMVKRWMAEFNAFNKVAFFYSPGGTSTGMGTLYAGVNNVAFFPRFATPLERAAYQHAMGHPPLEVKVGMGSYATDAVTPAIVVFVNKANPISRLTFKQLDGIFGAQRTGGLVDGMWAADSARSARDDIRTWGQLGLTGEWADKPIRPLGYDLVANGFAATFQDKVMKGADTWNPALEEFPLSQPGSSLAGVHKAGGRGITEAIGADRYAIGLANIQYAGDNPVKALAVAEVEGGPYVEATLANCENRTYPLTCAIHIYANLTGEPVDKAVKEFIRYVLSRDGQKAIVESGGGYLPLHADEAREELRKLE